MNRFIKIPGAQRHHPCDRGFTLIELMILIAISAIVLTLALPIYSNYAIRARISESLTSATTAKIAVAATCSKFPELTHITNTTVGYTFQPSEYLSDIFVQNDCVNPELVLITRNTGADPNITLILTGKYIPGSPQIDWRCISNNSDIYLPKSCKKALD